MDQGVVMSKLLAAVCVAAVMGAAAIVFTGLASSIEAHSTPRATKGDRLDARPYGAACSERSWPYYEPQCLRNRVTPTREARAVRIVAADRSR